MEISAYIEHLKERLAVHYDIVSAEEIPHGWQVELYARFSAVGSKHMLSRKVVLWSVGEYEHCLVRLAENGLTEQDIQSMALLLKDAQQNLVKPGPDHKRTVIRGVLITKGDPEIFKAQIRRVKGVINYRFMLDGWSEIQLVVVNPESGKLIQNARNPEDAKYIRKLYGI